MLNIDWDIKFTNKEGKVFRLAMLADCKIIKSVDNLTDIATITLPETVLNEPLHLESKIQRGARIEIKLGYNQNLKSEFNGYIREIVVNNGSLKIECEDALFLFRKAVKDKQFGTTNVKEIAQYLTSQIDTSYNVESDYDITYEKFTIHQATGYDVLKKLKEQTKANIFFDTKNKILHLHRPYTYKAGEVFYSLQKNVEKSNLEYQSVLDKKVEVTVESTDKKGNVQKYTTGTTGGDKITIKTGTMDKDSIKKLAETALKENTTPKYKGTLDSWLVPYVSPGYSAHIKDEDYPKKQGWYYIAGVTTSISSSGGKRTIAPSKKLSQ